MDPLKNKIVPTPLADLNGIALKLYHGNKEKTTTYDLDKIMFIDERLINAWMYIAVKNYMFYDTCYSFTECCIGKKVSQKCMPICTYNLLDLTTVPLTSEYFESCETELPNILKCGAGMNTDVYVLSFL